jgi:hypothetical protein
MGRGGKKIIQKMNAEILGKSFFSKNYFLWDEKENLEEYS